jgi:hypothetical protein
MKEGDSDFSYAPEAVKLEFDSLLNQMSEASPKLKKDAFLHFTPQFLDTVAGQLNIDDIMKIVDARQVEYKNTHIEQAEATVKIKTRYPITIVHVGDIHFGSVYCNHKLWQHHMEKVAETPGVYMMLYHNLVDNAIPAKYPANMLANSLPPPEQFGLMQHWIKELDKRGKILGAVTSDCHEGWSKAMTGYGPDELLFGYKGRKFPVLKNGGILYLKAGDETYGIGMWHKQGPFNSNFNTEHALRQNRRLRHESKTDLEVGAHYHNSAASSNYEGAMATLKAVNYVRVGTYKGVPTHIGEWHITDRWAVDKFGTSGQPPGVNTMLFPDMHIISDDLDFETGIEKHLAFRTIYMAREMGLGDKLMTMLSNGK